MTTTPQQLTLQPLEWLISWRLPDGQIVRGETLYTLCDAARIAHALDSDGEVQYWATAATVGERYRAVVGGRVK